MEERQIKTVNHKEYCRHFMDMVYKEDPGDLGSTLPEGCPNDSDFKPSLHSFVSNIASAKARVTPLKAGLTVPRSEMSSVVLCRRLQHKITNVLQMLQP